MAPKAAKAKAVGKAVTKASGKASAPEPEPPLKPSVPAVPQPSEAVTLTAKQAEGLLASLCAEELRILAETTDEEEQLAARQVLEYVGDKDVSWENAQRSLSTGNQLVNEILEMQTGEFITKQSLQRFEELGHPDVSALWGKSRSAYVLAVFVQACLQDARDRLGLTAAAPPPPPMPQEPPAWPLVIGFKELPARIAEVVRWSRTVLVVCNGHAKEADTFLTYSAYVQIDAKWVMGETMIRKTMGIEEMQESLRKRVVSAMKSGLPLHIAMANTAVAFKDKFCAEHTFPHSVFNFSMFRGETGTEAGEYRKIIRDVDLEDWPGSFPGRMKEGFFVVVTTDFDLESAREFLPSSLPYFNDMAILEVMCLPDNYGAWPAPFCSCERCPGDVPHCARFERWAKAANVDSVKQSGRYQELLEEAARGSPHLSPDKERQLQLDLDRTWPSLRMFSEHSGGRQSLANLLKAWIIFDGNEAQQASAVDRCQEASAQATGTCVCVGVCVCECVCCCAEEMAADGCRS
ncbi:unnamed protein product [Symbiodinium necroappetens]|uniref:Uncharacterized protein n=1 Tax=Symbiodinium necroappetens TaxID=1628268 RepID=A0A812NLU3_9DINO|nr:unnamed protein product [Symbiodinium necroappetens]